MSKLPINDQDRSQYKIWSYIYKYFPDAILAQAKHSYLSNLKHNGTEGMIWNTEKSIGDGEQIMRHLFDGFDAHNSGNYEEAAYHFTCVGWRGNELNQRYLTRMKPFDFDEKYLLNSEKSNH